MTLHLNRRALLMTGGFGLGALALPGGRVAAQALLGARGFTHNVASGEPGPDSMLLWTRLVPANGGDAHVRVEVAETAAFSKVVAGGQMITGPWRDHSVKIIVDGLQPGRNYHYRFIGPDGSTSPIGRTKTLPAGAVKNFRIAVFSCSNLGFGYFNAYAHAAARSDVDLVMHLGDYIYEYKRGGYDLDGFARIAEIQPAHEILALADYRLRYASYRADPDLQAIHQNFPVIASQDDHESANDAWEGGAQNHQANEGDWAVRRAAAFQAWREWLPVGEEPWKAYEIGSLATLLRTDSRAIARTHQWVLGEILAGKDAANSLGAFRDGPWQDPAATMFGTEQESWIAHQFAASVRKRQPWQILGSGTVMGTEMMPLSADSWIDSNTAPPTRNFILSGIAATKAGLPFNYDSWGGYPAARSRLLKSAQAAGANLVVLSGDSHNAWAHDLIEDKRAAGVEFAGQSVTSPGFENATRATPTDMARAFVAASPELKWADTSNRGYMHVTLTPESATNEWVFMDSVLKRGTGARIGKRLSVKPRQNRLEGV
jgi:alkaline phosphatase D